MIQNTGNTKYVWIWFSETDRRMQSGWEGDWVRRIQIFLLGLAAEQSRALDFLDCLAVEKIRVDTLLVRRVFQ